MKVVAFNGSPKKNGNTSHALKVVTGEFEKKGIEVEIIRVGNKAIRGCLACGKCMKIGQCVIDDKVNGWIDIMKQSDGIILASPVYFSGINGTMKSFLDRAGYVLSRQPGTMRYKVGASVVAVRRTGGMTALNELNHYINYFEMISPASNYWNVIYGQTPGQAQEDKEGNQIMRILGKNMAYLMQVLEYSKDAVEKPEPEQKQAMNFIR